MAIKKKVMSEDVMHFDMTLKVLATDISNAVDKYLTSGYFNYAAALGVLEDNKFAFQQLVRSRTVIPQDRIVHHIKDANYIG